MVERPLRMREAQGSIPWFSTRENSYHHRCAFFLTTAGPKRKAFPSNIPRPERGYSSSAVGSSRPGESSSYWPVYNFFASQSLHFITEIFLKKKFGDVNYEANFRFFILLHKRAKPIHPPDLTSARELKPCTPPLPSPSAYLSAHTSGVRGCGGHPPPGSPQADAWEPVNGR